LDFHIDQLPLDDLIAAEVALVVQAQSNHLHDLFDLCRGAVWAGKRAPRLTSNPFVSYRGHTASPICTAMTANDQEMHKCSLDLRHRRIVVQLLAFLV
jgi:hypothetical protein